jgi:hypothetical protein
VKPALIDDRLLGEVLRGVVVGELRERDLFTTGYWYVRLCQAAFGAGASSGVLSSPFASLTGSLRVRAMTAVMELPPSVGLISLRQLAPLTGQLRRDHPLNILGSEALAAAKHLGADVFLSAASPRLQEALSREGLTVRLSL